MLQAKFETESINLKKAQTSANTRNDGADLDYNLECEIEDIIFGKVPKIKKNGQKKVRWVYLIINIAVLIAKVVFKMELGRFR